MASHRLSLCTAVLLLVLGPRADALPMVSYTTMDLGGGLFQYFLTLDNSGGGSAIGGLLVLHGNSVFGLSDSSPVDAIGAPQDIGGDPDADWGLFSPLPPLVDELDYFSLASSADVPIDDLLDGFFFKSLTDPATLAGDDFAVEAIVFVDENNDGEPDAAVQLPLGNARVLPEPGLMSLCGIALASLAVFAHGRGRRAHAAQAA